MTGSVTGTDLKKPILPVTVAISGQNAAVQYGNSALDFLPGLLQVNAVVPQTIMPALQSRSSSQSEGPPPRAE